ncbi:MAG: hypothetical protein IKU42_08405 [Oscillospiraceae bacterium]|nr:hypothetical protein [Oscillospiraceae bacterium]
MAYLFVISIFYICCGIFGLFGKMNIQKKYRGYDWTKKYIKEIAVCDIILGAVWLILCYVLKQYDFGLGMACLLIILSALPSLLCSIFTEIKYNKLLKKD